MVFSALHCFRRIPGYQLPCASHRQTLVSTRLHRDHRHIQTLLRSDIRTQPDYRPACSRHTFKTLPGNSDSIRELVPVPSNTPLVSVSSLVSTYRSEIHIDFIVVAILVSFLHELLQHSVCGMSRSHRQPVYKQTPHGGNLRFPDKTKPISACDDSQ